MFKCLTPGHVGLGHNADPRRLRYLVQTFEMVPHIFQGPPVACKLRKRPGTFCAKLQQPALACVLLC